MSYLKTRRMFLWLPQSLICVKNRSLPDHAYHVYMHNTISFINVITMTTSNNKHQNNARSVNQPLTSANNVFVVYRNS